MLARRRAGVTWRYARAPLRRAFTRAGSFSARMHEKERAAMNVFEVRASSAHGRNKSCIIQVRSELITKV